MSSVWYDREMRFLAAISRTEIGRDSGLKQVHIKLINRGLYMPAFGCDTQAVFPSNPMSWEMQRLIQRIERPYDGHS